MDSRFNHYSHYLLSLDAQLERLQYFNRRFWNNRLPRRQFAAVNTSSDHTQRVEDLEVLYVDFGSPENTVELWWQVLVGTHQPSIWRDNRLKTDEMHLGLAESARRYIPGIHRIRINLVAYWQRHQGLIVREVRASAKANGVTLATAEVLAAYGLHDQLLQRMDGFNLPGAHMCGFKVTLIVDEFWRCVPYIIRSSDIVMLSAASKDGFEFDWACPVILES